MKIPDMLDLIAEHTMRAAIQLHDRILADSAKTNIAELAATTTKPAFQQARHMQELALQIRALEQQHSKLRKQALELIGGTGPPEPPPRLFPEEESPEPPPRPFPEEQPPPKRRKK
jgi:hypothetical protein